MRLSIDLSNKAGSLALHRLRDGQPLLVGSLPMNGENRHSELLLTLLEEFLEKHSVKGTEIKELVTSLGPGSFTGMRIAVSTLKAFSTAWGIPLFLLNGSEARARAFRKRHPHKRGDLLVLTRVASKTFSKALLTDDGKFREDESFELEGEIFDDQATLLVDSEDTQRLVEGQSIIFPIEAEYLGEQLEVSQIRTECRTFEDLVKATPTYYGSSRF